MTQDEVVEQMRRKIEARRQAFLKDLRLMRDLGVTLDSRPLVPILSSLDVAWECHSGEKDVLSDPCQKHRFVRSALEAARENGKIDIVDGGKRDSLNRGLMDNVSPEYLLHLQSELFLESGRTFIDPRGKVQFPVVTINVEFRDGTYWVAAWDWLAGGPFFVRGYPADGMNEARQDEISADLRQAVEQHDRTVDVDAAIAALPPPTARERAEAEAQAVYRLNHPPGWSEADIERAGESWEDLSDTFRITLEGRAFREEIDREDDLLSFISAPTTLRLTDRDVERLKGRALEIDGFLDGIVLKVTDEGDGLKLGADPRLQPDEGEFFRDKYGNVIEPSSGFHPDTGKPFFAGFSISPAYPLSGDPGSAPVRTVGVDLTRFGFGDHPKLLTVRSIAPARRPDAANPYFLYSTLPAADRGKAEGIYERASQLASQTEVAFGFTPGERIRNIFLVPSGSRNATVRFSNPATFFLWDELFDDLRGGKADDAVPHEVFHDFDAQFGFSREPAFVGMFTRLKKAEDGELFDAIDEKNFWSVGNFGHSDDNVREFFATLTNSIAAPQWAKKVEAMTPRVRWLYYHALLRLKGALLARHPQIASAPIYQRLGERIAALESMSGSGDGRIPLRPTPVPIVGPVVDLFRWWRLRSAR